ncbi:MAG: hypothetical protein U0I22_03170 [Treponema sp.]|nr:hypothetical protein [Treponema sp.]
MEDTKTLLGKINISLKKNLGKIIIALLLVFLVSGLLAPIAMVILAFGGAMAFFFAAFVMLLIAVILFMLQISFAQMCGKMYREEPCVLGNLLDSFRDWRRCGIFALVYAISAIIICIVVVEGRVLLSYLTAGADQGNFYSEDALGAMLSRMPVLVMVCMGIFFLLVLLPTAFTHMVLMDNQEMPLLTAIQENFRLLKGKKLQLVGFLFRTGGLWLVGALIFLGLSFAIVSVMYAQPETAENTLTLLSFASQICDMVYFICAYSTLIRLVTGVAAFYQAVQDEAAGKEPPLQIPSNKDSLQG